MKMAKKFGEGLREVFPHLPILKIIRRKNGAFEYK
jgi:hypothetical protein